jgi:hypothetical protein
MFNGKDHSQTEPWVASFKAYLQVNRNLPDDEECKTDTPTYGSPDVTYNVEDSLSRVLIVLSRMEGKAAEWATEQCQKWSTQITKQWRAAPTHTCHITQNKTMASFWTEFLEEWGDVRTWVKAETELPGLYQKELTVIDFWIWFRDLAQKANYLPDNNPTLCSMFRRKLAYRIQNHWTQPGSPEVQFFSIKAAFEHAISIKQTLNETATRQIRSQGSLSNHVHPAQTASAKAPTPAPDSAPQSNAATTFNITKVRCYNCEGKGHFAKDCPKLKKPRKAKASAAQGESDVELQLEQAMTNSLAQIESKSNSLSVRGSKRMTASRSQVCCHLVADQDPPNPNAAPKKLAAGPCPPASGISNLGPSLVARLSQAGLSKTNKPLPCPAASRASVASASNEDVAMRDADTDHKEAKRKLQARLDVLQREFTKLNECHE